MSEKKTHNFTDVRKLTDSKYLNLFEMDAIGQSGAHFNYYFASRSKESEIRIKTQNTKPEGMCVYAIKEDDPEQLLMVNQYRYPVDMYMYEVPAGLVEEGETPEECAIREIKEETGLDFTPIHDIDEAAGRPYVFAQGISDEMGVNVYGTVRGVFSKELLEDTERIDAFFVTKEEAKRILREEVLSMRAQFMLMHFIHSNPEDPFAFLKF